MALADVGKAPGRQPPVRIEDDFGYAKAMFVVPAHYEECVERVIIPYGLVRDRTEKLAFDIYNTYRGAELHLLCILKGSRGFFSQLLHYLSKIHAYAGSGSKAPAYMEHYVRLKSYSNDRSLGELKVISDDLSVLRGKHVLIVEDIIDTGNTLSKFCKWLTENDAHSPETIRVASMLEKRTKLSNGFTGDFVGFSVPDHFVIGFSLDYNEVFRDMTHICILNEHGKRIHRVKDA